MQLFLKSVLSKNIKKNFQQDENGAIAVVFAILLLPVMALTGATIDYSQASNIKIKMQKAVDAAALGAGRASKKNDNEAYLEGVAQDVFDAGMAQYGFNGSIDLDGGFTNEGNYRVEVDTRMDTNFLKMVGMSSLPVSVEAEVFLGSGGNLEVAMVYHTSESIDIGELKDGSEELIDELMSDDNGGNVKFSLVPFYKYVNIGTRSVDDDGNLGDLNAGSGWMKMTGFTNSPSSNASWNGCVGTRSGGDNVTSSSYAVRDDHYNSQKARAIDEHEVYCATRGLTPLTSNKRRIEAAVRRLTDGHSGWSDQPEFTHFSVGLVWGWASLSNNVPFTQGLPYSDENKKVLIFVVDRKNNKSMRVGEAGSWGVDVTMANKEAATLCSNIKKKGIRIYTIVPRSGNNSTSMRKVMSNCAGNGGKYFHVNSDEIEDAFEDIADDLEGLVGGGGDDLRLVK